MADVLVSEADRVIDGQPLYHELQSKLEGNDYHEGLNSTMPVNSSVSSVKLPPLHDRCPRCARAGLRFVQHGIRLPPEITTIGLLGLQAYQLAAYMHGRFCVHLTFHYH